MSECSVVDGARIRKVLITYDEHTFLVMMKLVPIATDPETAKARPMYLSSTMTTSRSGRPERRKD